MELTETNYVDEAEKVIGSLVRDIRNNNIVLTTTKLRSILAMIADIGNQVSMFTEEKLSTELQSQIKYLKVRCIYECGRDATKPYPVKDFVEKSDLIHQIDKIGDSKEKFLLFNKYVEALVAYHRFEGGKEQ